MPLKLLFMNRTFRDPKPRCGVKLVPMTVDPTRRNALTFGSQKINLHRSGKEFEPKAQYVQPGSADLCFLTDEKVEQVFQAFQDAKIEVLEGAKIVDRTGAVGKIRSVYVRDPDGNLIEISNYA